MIPPSWKFNMFSGNLGILQRQHGQVENTTLGWGD